MVDVARVNLYGQPVGTVSWDRRYDIARFEYAPEFVRKGIEPSPLVVRQFWSALSVQFCFSFSSLAFFFSPMMYITKYPTPVSSGTRLIASSS